MTSPADDFEVFWRHFLTSHTRSATRWAHVAAVVAPALCIVLSLVLGQPWFLAVGAVLAFLFAVGGHKVFEDNTPENFHRPLWAARAFTRLCIRTVTGSIAADMAELSRASGPPGKPPA